jgi:hypothetical protein
MQGAQEKAAVKLHFGGVRDVNGIAKVDSVSMNA